MNESNGSRVLLLITAHLVVAALIYIIWKSDVGDFAQGAITLILGKFLGFLDVMYGYEYNTTRSSKTKDETIQGLAEKASTPPRRDTRASDVPTVTDTMTVKADTVTVTEQPQGDPNAPKP